MIKIKLWIRYIKKVLSILFAKGYEKVCPPEDAADLTYETDTIRVVKEPNLKEVTEPIEEEWLLYIILDAGHGPTSPGKRSPYHNGKRFYEWEFNLDVINRVASKLTALDIPFSITNKALESISCTGNCLKERVEYINKYVDVTNNLFPIVISQHANAWGKTWNSASGSEVWVYNDITSKNNIRALLAECFLKHYLKNLGTRNRGIKMKESNQFYMLRKTKYLSFLLEPGFFTNLNEMKLLDSEKGRELVAKSCVDAIIDINKLLINNPKYITTLTTI